MLYASRLSTTPTRIVCLPQQTRNLIRYAIFSQIGAPRREDCLAPLWECRREALSQGHNDKLPSSGTKPIAENLHLPNCALIH